MHLRYTLESLYRNRGRYALFGILFAVLSAAWLITLLLGTASDALRETLIDTYGRAVVIEEVGTLEPWLDEAFFEQYNDPELVEQMEITAHVKGRVDGLISSARGITYSKTIGTFMSVVGYDYSSPYTPFTRKMKPYVLTSGRLPEAENECLLFDDMFDELIEDGVLERLGDSFVFRLYVDASVNTNALLALLEKDETLTDAQRGEAMIKILSSNRAKAAEWEMTVVGTLDRASTEEIAYQHEKQSTTMADDQSAERYDRRDIIFTDLATAKRCIDFSADDESGFDRAGGLGLAYAMYSHVEVVYHLRDYADLPKFEKIISDANHKRALTMALANESKLQNIEIEDIDVDAYLKLLYESGSTVQGMTPIYRVRPYLEGFAAMIAPLETVGDFTDRMAFNLALLSAAMFVLLTILSLYSRTYEIGVLRCVGMSRARITLNLMAEHGTLLLASLAVGILLGGLCAGEILPLLLDEAYREYLRDATAGLPRAAGLILGCGVGLTLPATFGMAVFIQRYRPLAILRNRN